MTNKIYTNYEIIEFYEKYQQTKLPLTKFATDNDLKISALRGGFRRLGFKPHPLKITKRKHQINENFFETIDSESKAYFLGFIFADGCNSKRRLEVSLAEQDVDILEILSILLLNTIDVKKYKREGERKQCKVALYVVSDKLTEDLSKLGCVPRKTFVLKFPNIPENLHNHFIRGYFDGDGSLTFNVRKNRHCLNTNFSVVSTMEMLIAIGNIINNLGVSFNINKRHKDRNNNNYTLRVFGNRQIAKVCDFLYKNSTIFLNRKFKSYQNLLKMNETNQKWCKSSKVGKFINAENIYEK